MTTDNEDTEDLEEGEVPCPRCGEPISSEMAEIVGFGDCCDGH